MNLGVLGGIDRRSTLPIGVFDSGLGGLTVWQELRRQLPHESILYLGDTSRVPYGTKAPTQILYYVRQIMAWMLVQPVKMIVMACNTSSALALEHVRAASPVPVLGLILPGARAAIAAGSRIGVIATPATAASHAYQQAITECSLLQCREAVCWEEGCPEFVPLIEANQLESVELQQAVTRRLQPLLDRSIDTLIYGCTHYPLIDPVVRQVLPASIQVIDPAQALVRAIAQELDLWGIRNGCASTANHTQFYVSGDPDQFATSAIRWLGYRPQVGSVPWSEPMLVNPQELGQRGN